MDFTLKAYVALWATACATALGLYLAPRDRYVISPEYLPGRGVIFSFMREGWPSRPLQSSVLRIAAWGAVFAVPAIAAVLIYIL